MSYPIFPSTVKFKRPAWRKTPHYNTVKQETAVHRGTSTASLMAYPTWDFEAELILTKGDESNAASVLAAFLDVYMQCLGQGGLFLISDPNDNTVAQAAGVLLNVTPGAATPMGKTGDGVSTQFQLARTIGTSGKAVDIIQNVVGTPTVYVNGISEPCSISATGVVTFNPSVYGPPPSNASLAWAGSFYFLCRFDKDTLGDLARMGTIPDASGPNGFDGLWECGNIRFSSEFV